MKAARTIVVLGAGVGGRVAAAELRRRLDARDRVVVVERDPAPVFQPSLLWLAVGRRRPESIVRPVARSLATGVESLLATVQAIDPITRTIETSSGPLSADALVVALGADLAPHAVEGFADAAHSVFTLDGAAACARALDGFRGGRVVVVIPRLPYKCPAAPYEAALLLDDELRRRGLRARTEIDLLTPEPQPLPVAGPAIGEAVTRLLEERSIRLQRLMSVERIEPGAQEIVLADGVRVPFDLLVGIPPHVVPAPVAGSGLAGPAGWIPVDRGTLATAFERVHAVGDVTAIGLANGKPLPKAGVFAHAEALAAADAIAAALGRPSDARRFDGAGACWLETGRGEAAFASGAFFAEPDPVVSMRGPGRGWHLGKVLFERYWLTGGLERLVAAAALRGGAKALGLQAPI